MQPDEYPIYDYSEDNFSFSPFDFDQGMYEEILCPPEDYESPAEYYPESPPRSPADCYFHNYPDSPCSVDSVPPSPPYTPPQGELPQASYPYTVQHFQLNQIAQNQVEMKVVLSFPSQPPLTQTMSMPQVTFPCIPESEPENCPEFTQIILDPNRSDVPSSTDYFIQMKSLPFDVSRQLTDYQYERLYKLHSKRLLLNSHPVMTERDLEAVRSCGLVYFLKNVKTIVPKIGPWKFNCHTRNTDGDRSFNIPGMAITCKVKEWLSDDGLWRLYHYKAGKRQGAQ